MSGQQTTPYKTLNGAQARLRDAYFDHESGLHVMNAVPGAGKSVTVADIAARELLRRHADGHPAPEETLAVVSFNAEQADELAPKVAERMETLVEHDATAAAKTIDEYSLRELTRAVRQADAIGTVDALLRKVFADIVSAVGFTEMPAVGDDLHLQQLHRAIYADLASDDAVTDDLTVLMEAYPPGQYVDDPADLLRQGLHLCRQQRLSTAEFREQLLESVAAVYPDGPPEDGADLRATLDRVLETVSAEALDAGLTDEERETLIKADTALYEDWQATIEAYTRVLDAYRDRYRTAIREEGVLSHTDVSYLLAGFLDGTHSAADEHPALRERVLARYRHRLQHLIVDEAQDIATIQHDALKPLVTEQTRVFLAGDLRQSIYVWRDARPSLFARAIEDGQYFGQDWTTHVVETTQTTYRARPDIAAAVDAICEPALTDDARGNLASFEVEYPRLKPSRESVEGANVHVAGYAPTGPPSTPWAVADGAEGEAPALATRIARGLANGDFDTVCENPSVLVLFRWRTHMDGYREAFEAAGLSVANAASYLFEADVTRIVFDVLDWLADPGPESLAGLVRHSALNIQTLEPGFEGENWSLPAVIETADKRDALDEQVRGLLEALDALRRRAATVRTRPIPVMVRAVIDTLGLREDTYDLTTADPDQRVATCDSLETYIADATDDDDLDLQTFLARVDRVREAPYTGPTQPIPDSNADVVFQTTHQAKGREADIVALADPGFGLQKHGPVCERLLSSSKLLALAPPADHAGTITTADGDTVDLDGEYGGLYTTTADQDPNTEGIVPVEGGLRWASERWRQDEFVGHDHLQQAVASNRAESWRLLYVALTRARNHLVLPVPWSRSDPTPRDRWLDTLIEGLDIADRDSPGDVALDVPPAPGTKTSRQPTIAITDADLHEPPSRSTSDTRPPRRAGTRPLSADTLDGFVPRFIRPSTVHPLSEDPEKHVLAHLQNRAIHSDSESITADLADALDAYDADAVGKLVHDVLTGIIADDLTGSQLETLGPPVQECIDAALGRHGPPAHPTERAALVDFVTETVLPQFRDSKLREQVRSAEAVFVEVPLRDALDVRGVTVEVDGQADVLVRNSDGWAVWDLKVSLAASREATQTRYRTQAALYADILASHEAITAPVAAGLQSVGVKSGYSQSPWPDLDVDATLARLADVNRNE